MRLKPFFIGGVIVALLVAIPFKLFGGVEASSHTVNIVASEFIPTGSLLPISLPLGDSLLIKNTDPVTHTTLARLQSDPTVIEWSLQTYDAKVGTQSADSHSHVFNTVGVFELLLDGDVKTTVTVSAATPTATPTPTVSPTIAPTATATPTLAPTATPTSVPTATPSPTASPTIAPTATPTVAPTATPTIAPTATPSVTPTASPTAVPSASPTLLPTSRPSPVPTVSPTVAPTAVPTLAPSPTVTASPMPTMLPLPAVLPSFSIFRTATCSSQLNSSTTQVITDKVSAAYLTRGYWAIESLNNQGEGLSATVRLTLIQRINLLFQGSSFFGGNQVTRADQLATFTAPNQSALLQKAAVAWCAR